MSIMISVNYINIYDAITPENNQEITDILLRSAGANGAMNLRIERIVSNGEASPPDFWYDQDFNEWCCLVHGCAVLQTELQEEIVLSKGDSCFLSRHLKHRVSEVSDDAIWITVCWH
ncbi:MAG: hypothetical protein ACRCZQ_02355 [Bacteroidales bacterium]